MDTEDCIKTEDECDRPTGPCEKKTKRQRKCKEEDNQDIDMGADCAPRRRKRVLVPVEPTRQSTRIKIVKEAKEAVEQHAKEAAAAKVSRAAKRVRKTAAAAAAPISMDEVEDIIQIEAEHASAIRTLYQDFGVLKGIRLDPHMTRLVDLQHPNHFRDLYDCISQKKKGANETFVMDVIESIQFIEPQDNTFTTKIDVDVETNQDIELFDTTIVNINNMVITLTTEPAAPSAAPPAAEEAEAAATVPATVPQQITSIIITRTPMVGTMDVIKKALKDNQFVKVQLQKFNMDISQLEQVNDGEYHIKNDQNNMIIISLSSLLQRDNGTDLLLEIIATTIRAKQLNFKDNIFNKFHASMKFKNEAIKNHGVNLFNESSSFIRKMCKTKLDSFLFESLQSEIIKSGNNNTLPKSVHEIIEFNYEQLLNNFTKYSKYNRIDQDKSLTDFASEFNTINSEIQIKIVNEDSVNTAIQLLHQARRPLLLFDLLKSAEFNTILLYDLVNTHLVKGDSNVNVKLLFKQSSDPLIVQMNSQTPPPRNLVRTRGRKTTTIVPYTGLPIENVFKVSRTLINKLNVRGAKPFENNHVFMMPTPAVGVVRLSMKEIAILNIDSLNIMARYGIVPVKDGFSVGLDFYEILSEHHSFEEFRRKFETENYYLLPETKLDETESEQFLKKMRDVIETGIALCDLSDQLSAVAIGGGKKPRAQAKNIQEKFDSVKVWIRNKVQRISETAKRITPPKRKPQPVKKQAKKKP